MRVINIIKVVCVLCTIASFNSCQDYLEVTPKSSVSETTLWSESGNAELFLNGIYGSIRGPIDFFDHGDNFTDNTISQYLWSNSRSRYVLGISDPSTTSNLQQWNSYDKIRKCNVFISNIESSDIQGDWKKLRIAEARFLRAYFYSILWTSYGGVPIITDVLDRNEQGDEIFRARNSDAETFQFIVSECEAIVNDLPVDNGGSRASKGSVLTLQAWCELFNASPLKNEQNISDRWASAAATYKKVMDLNYYSLFPDRETLFYEANNNNSEIIFDKSYLGGTSIGNSRSGLQPIGVVGGTQNSWSGVNVTQELVDEYCMANGLPIDHPESGYDPQNPYHNREKRFYQDVIFDGAIFNGLPAVYRTGSGSLNELDLNFGSTNRPCTVYHPRKAIEEQYYVNGHNRLSSANWSIFRYAEVLLGYAEAQNEAVGPDASVYEAMNEIRARVDLPSLVEGLTQDEMRIAIHRERRVELCFEDKRWPDLIRLKIAHLRIPGPLHTMVIEEINGVKKFDVVETGGNNRAFDENKNYVLPIPQYVIDQNSKIDQNPGY
ncbi:RagB/SusD family nutrient uptake outer membrane protein [Membranihabitans marinus]|uniref:RagB/SusD family nutrient uptake outer membrane protein n=1 Tax=Membranihabitans marinus TaxID=1227546 RepID=UPI001F2B19E2|nr:RagB/SusD family nutrient uptake outer membrane protein [Membranihabitans marinus]